MRYFVKNLVLILVVGVAVANVSLAFGETAAPVPLRSVFVVPASAQEGRDPFFPESSRTHEGTAVSNRTAGINDLTIKGFSGKRNHRMVIINNHTFSAGDEGDVKIPGGRIHLRCLEIHATMVVIEVNGQKRELNLDVK
jgi:hypothetical protein